jgi:hypothetical protein
MRGVRPGLVVLGVPIRRVLVPDRVRVGPRVASVRVVQVQEALPSRMGPNVPSEMPRVALPSATPGTVLLSGRVPAPVLGIGSPMLVGRPVLGPEVPGKDVRSRGLVVLGERVPMRVPAAGTGALPVISGGLVRVGRIGVLTARAEGFVGSGPGKGRPRRGARDPVRVDPVSIVHPGCSMPQARGLRGNRWCVPRGNPSLP